MKITTQLLRSRAGRSLHSCEYLDLSDANIDTIQRLQSCPKLKSINLARNNIDFVSNLDSCSQLWKLDISNNKVRNLEGLSKFVAVGTLVLSNNEITWSQLAKIRHMHILNISLNGNPILEKDPYYRIHIIDCLPHIWMLDGRIVTCAERLQVQQFFEESALTDHPVRHKLSKDNFVPSALKKREVNGTFGERTDHFMRRFPTNGALNVDTDRRRLKYLAYSFQEDLKVDAKYNKSKNYDIMSRNKHFLEEFLESREEDRVKCNMVLLLLVASLEFAMPSHLMQEALKATTLDRFRSTVTMELFLLPRETRCLIVTLLLSAVKVDKDVGEDGGLYDKLYLCLYNTVSELTRLAYGGTATLASTKLYSFYRESRCLIAAEVVQLLCIVPAFFEYVTKESGTMNLLTVACNNVAVIEKVQRLSHKLEKEGRTTQVIYEHVGEMILSAIRRSTTGVMKNKGAEKDNELNNALLTHKAIPRRAQSTPMASMDYHVAGRSSPIKEPVRLKSGKHDRKRFVPQGKLGEKILLGPQNLGRIISIPEPDIALIQMDSVPVESGAMISNKKNPEEHYTYIDMNHVTWDHLGGYWRPNGTVGDRITMHNEQEGKEKGGRAVPPTVPDLLSQPSHMDKKTAGRHMEDDALPDPVSARFKQEHNLKLQLSPPIIIKEAGDDEESLAAFTHNSLETNSTGTGSSARLNSAAGKTTKVPSVPSDNAKKRCEAVISPIGSQDEEMLYSTHVAPRSSPTTVQDATSTDAPEFNGSRRSSLESAEEPELGLIGGDSRPSTRPTTAVQRPKSGQDSAISVSMLPGDATTEPEDLTDAHIQIPQVDEDPELTSETRQDSQKPLSGELLLKLTTADLQSISQVSDLSHRGISWSLPTTCTSSARTKTTPRMHERPVSALDAYRMIVARDATYHTDKVKPAHSDITEDSMPPPQRPSSPTPVPGSTQAQRIIKVQKGTNWLAGGKNVFWEKQNTRPTSGHQPGWTEGLPSRPKSAAAIRANKRSKTPNIITPSSMAYDSAYNAAADFSATPDLTYTSNRDCRPVSAQPSSLRSIDRPYSNIWSGQKHESLPSAKQLYYIQAMKMRNPKDFEEILSRRSAGRLCEQCMVQYQQQEQQLMAILGDGNADLVAKLARLEPCTHFTTPQPSACTESLQGDMQATDQALGYIREHDGYRGFPDDREGAAPSLLNGGKPTGLSVPQVQTVVHTTPNDSAIGEDIPAALSNAEFESMQDLSTEPAKTSLGTGKPQVHLPKLHVVKIHEP